MDQAPSVPLTSPSNRKFGRLNYDIWHECIRLVAVQSVGGPLPYLAVSSSWAELIIDSPHLWKTILFDGGEDEEARTHTFSHLSQDLPLHLIYLYSRDGKTIEYFINNHSHRIRSIEDRNEFREGASLSTILGTVTTSLPALRYLDGDGEDISEGFFSNCVNLRVLQWPQLRIADEAYLGPHVECIRFYDVEPSMTVNLTYRTNIRTLELDLRRMDSDGLWDENGEAFKAPMANLFTKIGQTLSDLSLMISFCSYSVFIPLLSSIPGLHTLSLHLNVTQSLHKDLPQSATPQINYSDFKSLRDLSIVLMDAHGFDEDDEDSGDWAGFNSGLADTLIRSLTVENTLRDLEAFDFYSQLPYQEHYIGPLLQSVVSARVVRASGAYGMIPISLRMERQLMPRLQSLELPSLGLYNCIDAPNLIELTFSDKVIRGTAPVETNATTDLQRLTLPGDLMNDTGKSMQSLWNSKLINFTTDICPQDITPLSRLESVEFSDGDAAVNEFLLKILENPKVCPQLHTIAIEGYPLWELLFEVLRQRNSSGVRRITQITLPRLPVFQLLWRLVRLLGGKTAVFTNRDVDAVIEKRITSPPR
jgi:hypothetical protein